MKNAIALLLVFFCSQQINAQTNDYLKMSTDLVLATKAKNKNEVEKYVKLIETADEDELLKQLNNDDAKKTFFINIYNSFVIYALTKDVKLFDDRGAFFKAEQFKIAGNKVSLDDIEHDFLRRSSLKLGLGKIHKIFPGKLERKFRVENVDWRIHFSLNCGAKSCPPVFAYEYDKIESQINESAEMYFKANSKFDKKENTLFVPVLMSWFRGDFGSKKGVKRIAKQFGVIDQDINPSIKYNDYDWTVDINNFR